MKNPKPKKGKAPETWALVIVDMMARNATGRKKYGVAHQADNGRDHLLDAYEEALDLCCYLKAELSTRDHEE